MYYKTIDTNHVGSTCKYSKLFSLCKFYQKKKKCRSRRRRVVVSKIEETKIFYWDKWHSSIWNRTHISSIDYMYLYGDAIENRQCITRTMVCSVLTFFLFSLFVCRNYLENIHILFSNKTYSILYSLFYCVVYQLI